SGLTTEDSRLTTQARDSRLRLETHDSGSRLTTQDSRLEAHDSRLTTHDSRRTTHGTHDFVREQALTLGARSPSPRVSGERVVLSEAKDRVRGSVALVLRCPVHLSRSLCLCGETGGITPESRPCSLLPSATPSDRRRALSPAACR